MAPFEGTIPLPPVPPASSLRFSPIENTAGFGMALYGAECERLSEEEFTAIREAVLKYDVLVIKGQEKLNPEVQLNLTRRFDPTARVYGHGNAVEAIKKSVLQNDIISLPLHPEVKLLGNGELHNHEGLAVSQLKHPMHSTFHKDPISAEEAEGSDATRFYRWHIDAALYDLHPPVVTTLLALQVDPIPVILVVSEQSTWLIIHPSLLVDKVPGGRTQVVRYDDGSGDELPVSLGATAFVSGTNAFEALSATQKRFALRTRVQYAAHPYVWMKKSRAHSTGLVMETEGLELPREDLPEVDESKVKIVPMVWKNPVTGKPSLQIHGCCIQDLITDGKRLGDLGAVRAKVYEIMRPGIAPHMVYAHDWSAGDLVIFNNRGVWHSVVGTLKPSDKRVFHQCNLAGSEGPLLFSEEEIEALVEGIRARDQSVGVESKARKEVSKATLNNDC